LTLKAAAACAGLSVLFVVVYSGTNWLTSFRSDVGVWYYEWERFIPFVPLMAIPYMSIDLFFVAAPFLCRDDRELTVFLRRVALAIVLAGVCFLIMPLRLAVDRPQLDGWLGAMFGWFFSSDLPYNLCPSLHIALRTILADKFASHTRGFWNVASHVWFSLIGLSTVLMYQHHVVDVAGGFLLAVVCFYVLPALPHRHPVAVNRRVGSYYFLLAIVFAGIATVSWPWGAIMMWPAIGCVLVAGAYFGLGPGIYRKMDGRLAFTTKIVLGPVLFGQYLSLLYYRRQCHAWDRVTPGLWIGRKLSDAEAAKAVREGVTAVLDLTAEFSEAKPFRETRYLNVPILDLTAPTREQIERCHRFLAENADGVVYVHCKIGYSRTAAVAGTWLIASRHAATADEAASLLRAARPPIIIRPEARAAMKRFEDSHRIGPPVYGRDPASAARKGQGGGVGEGRVVSVRDEA
jgi:protein-tyrosine phosphatase/membrane-associated phospholipid phosphatase